MTFFLSRLFSPQHIASATGAVYAEARLVFVVFFAGRLRRPVVYIPVERGLLPWTVRSTTHAPALMAGPLDVSLSPWYLQTRTSLSAFVFPGSKFQLIEYPQQIEMANDHKPIPKHYKLAQFDDLLAITVMLIEDPRRFLFPQARMGSLAIRNPCCRVLHRSLPQKRLTRVRCPQPIIVRSSRPLLKSSAKRHPLQWNSAVQRMPSTFR
jgi:hypothetical protein